MDLVLVPVNSHPHSLLDVCRGDIITQIHHELGELFHIDYILGIFRRVTALDYFRDSSNLQRLFALHNQLISICI